MDGTAGGRAAQLSGESGGADRHRPRDSEGRPIVILDEAAFAVRRMRTKIQRS